ncbi:uncharacterized protein LOC121881113 isoform X2 [Thunnus maccoyii]|uniref:uncharacterized protein LOC121881113 isoform X2 n=1 Tax=Thunnus maccoyii TaxID=8240 RepID=UPI001C4AB3F8|nr:uncharacterized protein LOC121881113 isoform X2 [Thunnus maccoyii]
MGISAYWVQHTSLEKPSKALLREIVQKGSLQNRLTTPGIVWGRDHEREAIETYKYAPGLTNTRTAKTSIAISNEVYTAHKSFSILRAGFRVCKNKPYIGVSCDAYISCDCCEQGVVETKCPLKWVIFHLITDKTLSYFVTEGQPQLLHPGAAADATETISHFWPRHIYPQLAGTSVPETELELQETEVESTHNT